MLDVDDGDDVFETKKDGVCVRARAPLLPSLQNKQPDAFPVHLLRNTKKPQLRGVAY